MPNLEGIRLRFRKIYIYLTANIRKKLLMATDFTIISNNCWGGFVYQSYGLPYNSPTVGLYFMADDYIKFVYNLQHYINTELQFISPETSRYYNIIKKDKRFGNYPIGKLNDIEIMFLHYDSEKEAYAKWKRRCERINWNKMLIKFNDQNGCADKHLNSFDKLNFKNKLCFTSKEYSNLKSIVFIRPASRQENVYASQEPIGKSKYININKLLNSL